MNLHDAKESQRKANVRLAWILASTAVVFALGVGLADQEG